MTPGEALRILAALCDAMWDGDITGRASAGEVSRELGGGYGHPDAQNMGRNLAILERGGLVESKDEGWGKMWRPSAAVRVLVEQSE